VATQQAAILRALKLKLANRQLGLDCEAKFYSNLMAKLDELDQINRIHAKHIDWLRMVALQTNGSAAGSDDGGHTSTGLLRLPTLFGEIFDIQSAAGLSSRSSTSDETSSLESDKEGEVAIAPSEFCDQEAGSGGAAAKEADSLHFGEQQSGLFEESSAEGRQGQSVEQLDGAEAWPNDAGGMSDEDFYALVGVAEEVPAHMALATLHSGP